MAHITDKERRIILAIRSKFPPYFGLYRDPYRRFRINVKNSYVLNKTQTVDRRATVGLSLDVMDSPGDRWRPYRVVGPKFLRSEITPQPDKFTR